MSVNPDAKTGTHASGEIWHPAFGYLTDDLLSCMRVSCGRGGVLVSFAAAGDVAAASECLRAWDPEGTRYEHHVHDRGSIVLDWE